MTRSLTFFIATIFSLAALVLAARDLTPGDSAIDLRLALAPRDFAGLEAVLYAVSTPGHARYGQHLSKAEAEAFAAPSAGTIAAMDAWLAAHNLTATRLSSTGDWLGVQMPAEQADAVFAAEITHEQVDMQAFRTAAYAVPAELQGHVRFVHPATASRAANDGPAVARARPKRALAVPRRDAIPTSCNLTVTPSCVQSVYSLPTALANQKSNSIGVIGLDGEYANAADLKVFLQTYRPDLDPDTGFAVKSLDGGANPQDPELAGIEADLDIQWTVGLASGVPVTFYTVGAGANDWDVDVWIDLAYALLAEETLPTVLSTSYSIDEHKVSVDLATKLCNLYAQLGARGTTVIFSSGDGGVAGGVGGDCTTFLPTFPSTCPYVTSVGATAYLPPELAAPYSSGGFSNVFASPAYQDAAVSSFVDRLGDTYNGLYNASGRAYPDISAQGADMVSIWQGEERGGGGTSFAAPVIASTIALLNDELIAAGKSPLGFINPLLYAAKEAFKDVTRGNNPGCGTPGFNAVPGWDPISGIGTPVYSALKAAIGL